jgi:hypothetical protein
MMTTRYGMTSLVALTTLACTPASDAMTGPPVAQVRCEIRSTAQPEGVRLEALALADAPTLGTYEFLVTKEDGGGSSRSAQSGDFTLSPGQEAVLGEIDLGLDAGGGYAADLTVRWSGGETACRQDHPQQL